MSPRRWRSERSTRPSNGRGGGGGFDVVWPQFLMVGAVGGLFFALAVLRFRSSIAQAA